MKYAHVSKAHPLRIAVAVIERGDEVLIGLRGNEGPLAGYWEFPGGKVESSESCEQAAAREVWEETGLRVDVGEELAAEGYVYPHAQLSLRFFRCILCRESIHAEGPLPDRFRWVRRHELRSYRFPRANAGLIEALCRSSSTLPRNT